MYQQIFVPIDSSAPSNIALKEAIKLAKGLGSTLIIAHSVDLAQYGRGNPEQLDVEALEQAVLNCDNIILQAACDKARAEGVNVQPLLLQNHGDPIATVLLDAAHTAQAELIVMGTHGRTGIKHLLLGSVAEGVLRASDLPVLLIRYD